jgi:hypothetical protein
MNQYTLFVGDVGKYLAVEAKKFANDVTLVSKKNLEKFLQHPTRCGYTSLADIGSAESLRKICYSAHRIVYVPPDTWANESYGQRTEQLLYYIQQSVTYYGPVLTLNPPAELNFLQSGASIDPRVGQDSQIWVVGCSVSHGVGVETHETYAHVLQHTFNRPVTKLTCPGSSIAWAGDQICRADIKKDDLIFWGITSWDRLTYAYDKIYHVHARNIPQFDTPESLNTHRFIDDLESANTTYMDYLSILRACNFSEKLGAKLIMLGLLPDWKNYHIVINRYNFKQLVGPFTNAFIDLGTDNLHPGPKQHQQFAQEFVKFYKEIYGK